MKTTYSIEGMHCASCASKIEHTLNQIDGVKEAAVNLVTESATVDYNPDVVDFTTLQKAVAKVGYQLNATHDIATQNTIQTFQIDGMHCASCASKIEHTLKENEAIEKANVNLATEQLTVIWKDKSAPQDIEKAVAQLGYSATLILSAEEQYEQTQARKEAQLKAQKQQVIKMFAFTIPLFILTMGPMIGMPLPNWLSAHHAPLTNALVQLALTVPVLWIGRDLYIRGFKALLNKAPNMDSLGAVGTSAAFIQGCVMTLYLLFNQQTSTTHPELYFETAAVILTLMKLGKYMEEVAKGKTSAAIKNLMDLAPETARRILPDGTIEVVPLSMIQVGDHIQIRPGERLGVDGEIIEGQSSLDESMITGESLPVNKSVGDSVTGGSLNKTGSFTYQVNKIGQDTLMSQIVRLVQDAQGNKAEIAKLADIISLYFVPAVIVLAIITGLAWFAFGASIQFALKIFISVLIIACPCALGLATPTAIMVGTGLAAQKGILFKNGAALETMHQANAILLDKTGTITEGVPTVTDTLTTDAITREKLLSITSAVEAVSEHPLGEAIVEYVKEHNMQQAHTVRDFNSITGQGVTAIVDDEVVHIGNKRLLESMGITFDEAINTQATQLAKDGKTPLFVAINRQYAGIIAVSDPIKKTSNAAIKQLHKMGLTVYMLTGDNQHTANAIAQQVGIDTVYSEVLPEDKSNVVASIQNENKRVIMVGDGINDAPALAKADIGVAIGSGTDIAIESADTILMHNQLSDVVTAIELSHATLRNIKQNLFWAFLYNIIGIPVAMGLLRILFNGPLLDPMVAALAMSFSSISVLLNALRLRFFTPSIK